MKRKKIAFVIGSLSQGGAERVVSNLGNNLIDHFDVYIITFFPSKPFFDLHEGIKVVSGNFDYRPNLNVFQSLILNYRMIKHVIRVLKKNKIDLVIGFITTANIISVIAAKLVGIPSIISERNNPMFESVSKFWVFLRNLFYPRADFVVLQTSGVLNFYKSTIPSYKMGIFPNPISNDLSLLREKKPTKSKIILTVGRLDKNKGHNLLIEAFHGLGNNEWQLIIVGEGHYRPDLEMLVNNLNLSNNVRLVGAVKNVAKHYNNAAIFAFGSKSEGFPNALLEAMHFGLPCVSTDCPFGPNDLINNGENGYLIPVDDKKAMHDRLQYLMQNKEHSKRIGENARHLTEKFREETVSQKWLELIEKIIYKKALTHPIDFDSSNN